MKIKKIITLVIIIIISLLLMPNEVEANNFNDRISLAEIIPGIYIQSINPSENRNWGTPAQFIRRVSDNQFVYCIQIGIPINSSLMYNWTIANQWTYIDYLTEEQWERITLLAYYGYGFGNHNDPKWYAITQVLIQRTVAGSQGWTINFTNGLWGNVITPFEEEIAQLERLVSNHSIKPSFINENLLLKSGQTITLTDHNNVINNFTIGSNENLTVNRNENDLIITPKTSGRTSLELKKESTRFDMPPILYFVPGSQDVISVGNFNLVSARLNINVEDYGRLKITKYGQKVKITDGSFQYQETLLANVKFNIYANEDIYFNERLVNAKGTLVETIITDENGQAIFDSLYLGKYYLKEVETNDNHVLNNEVIYFEINEDNRSIKIEVHNEHKRGILEFLKTDIDNEPIPNTLISIYTTAGELIFNGMTNENGKIIIDDLFIGNFYIIEIAAADGFILDSDKTPFKITYHGEVVRISMINERVAIPDAGLDTINFNYLVGIILTFKGCLVAVYAKKD